MGFVKNSCDKMKWGTRARWPGLGMLAGLLLIALFLLSARPGRAGEPPLYPSDNERFGVCVVWEPTQAITNYPVEQIHAGWYVDFWHWDAPLQPAGMEFVQIIRVGEEYYNIGAKVIRNPYDKALAGLITETLGAAVDANPGSLWLVGNEPDRIGLQDGRPPDEYAIIYHDLYEFIKRRDPSARVAIGGIIQPTPIRLLYLDFILDEYQARYGSKIPVDVWNIHNFILCETCTWGATIPPGMENYVSLGKDYGVQDNDNIDIFRQQIWDFRQWMADHGEQDKPLIVSEYGVLMPEIFGFPHPRVRDFMLATFDFFLNTTDEALGYPADGNRLVQAWSWYSLNDYPYDPATGEGFNGNLFDHDTAVITPLGRDFITYTTNLVTPYIDLAVAGFRLEPASPISTTAAVTVTLAATITNRGNTAAQGVAVQFWNGHPDQGGVPIGDAQVIDQLPMRFAGDRMVTAVWSNVPSGVHHLYVEIDRANSVPESNEGNNLARQTILVNTRVWYFPIALS